MIRLLNFWRLRRYTDDGCTIEFFRQRNGQMVVTRVWFA